MKKLAHNLASVAEELYTIGFVKEAKNMLFTSLRLAHMDHPLHGVIEEMGFEKADDNSPVSKRLEIFIHVHPDGKTEYELVKDDDSHGFDNFEELVSHLTEEDESDCGCGCGGSGNCKEASSGIFRKADSLMDSLNKERDKAEYLRYIDGYGYTPGGYITYEDWFAKKEKERNTVEYLKYMDEFGYIPYKDWFAKKDRESYRTSAKKKKNQNKPLNKPFRTPGGPKKFSVYVKNEKGNVVKVNFGSPDMEIKRDDPKRRKSFRARHKCDTAKDPTKPRTWSCRMWQKGKSVSDMTSRKKK